MPRSLVALLIALALGGVGVAWLTRSAERRSAVSPGSETTRVDSSPSQLSDAPSEMTNRAPSDAGTTTRAAGTAKLVVTLVGKTDRVPLPWMRVRLTRLHSATRAEEDYSWLTSTDDLGVASFDVPPNLDLELSAWSELSDPGNAHTEISMLSPGERRDLSVEVSGAVTIRFHAKVMTSEGLQPISGALVEVTKTESTYWDNREGPRIPGLRRVVLCSTATESDGHFELRLRPGSGIDVSVQAAGRSIALVNVGPHHETREQSEAVLLRQSSALRARIADAEGHPLQEAAVRLSSDCKDLAEPREEQQLLWRSALSMHWNRSAGSDGVCALAELPSEVRLRVELSLDGRIVREDLGTITLAPGEDRSVEWRVGAGCTLFGLLVDQAGKAVTEVPLWLLWAETGCPTLLREQDRERVVLRTDSDSEGRFRFEDVPSGSWMVGPSPDANREFMPPSDAVATVAQRVEIREGTRNQQVTLVVARGLFARGTVLDALAKPAARVEVIVYKMDEPFELHGKSDDEGAFALGPLMQGSYWVKTFGRGAADSGAVEVQSGQSGVVLQLKPACILVGSVVDGSTGRGCPALVSLIRTWDADFSGAAAGASKADGTFRLEDLEPGSYHLIAHGAHGGFAVASNIVLRAGVESDEQTLTLSPGARLRIRNKSKAGWMSFTVRQAGVLVAESWARLGQSAETNVPSGHVVIRVTWQGGTSEDKELDLVAGEERELGFGGL